MLYSLNVAQDQHYPSGRYPFVLLNFDHFSTSSIRLLRDCITAMSNDTPETLRGSVALLCKQWTLLNIHVHVPDRLPKDSVREALDMLTNANAAAVKVVQEDILQAQRIVRCCLRDVQHLVPPNVMGWSCHCRSTLM